MERKDLYQNLSVALMMSEGTLEVVTILSFSASVTTDRSDEHKRDEYTNDSSGEETENELIHRS